MVLLHFMHGQELCSLVHCRRRGYGSRHVCVCMWVSVCVCVWGCAQLFCSGCCMLLSLRILNRLQTYFACCKKLSSLNRRLLSSSAKASGTLKVCFKIVRSAEGYVFPIPFVIVIGSETTHCRCLVFEIFQYTCIWTCRLYTED